MPRRSKSLPPTRRCSAFCKDGSRCAQYTSDLTGLCRTHAHGAVAALQAPSLHPDAPVEDIIRNLLTDRDPRIRAKAVELYQKWIDRDGCRVCEVRDAREKRWRERWDRALARFTWLQYVEYRAHIYAAVSLVDAAQDQDITTDIGLKIREEAYELSRDRMHGLPALQSDIAPPDDANASGELPRSVEATERDSSEAVSEVRREEEDGDGK